MGIALQPWQREPAFSKEPAPVCVSQTVVEPASSITLYVALISETMLSLYFSSVIRSASYLKVFILSEHSTREPDESFSQIVFAVFASAKPATAELNSAYKALCNLQDKYNTYLDYVVNATKFGNYEAKCDSYMSSFTSYAASNFSLSAMNTSAQSATDKAEYYADVVSEAVAAAENASHILTIGYCC